MYIPTYIQNVYMVYDNNVWLNRISAKAGGFKIISLSCVNIKIQPNKYEKE
jgi:hypothetical protein